MRWPAARIVSAIAASCGMRRAASTTSWPFSAKMLASAVPIPDEAPVINVTGFAGTCEIRPALAVLSMSIESTQRP